jgi:hypothetical protein
MTISRSINLEDFYGSEPGLRRANKQVPIDGVLTPVLCITGATRKSYSVQMDFAVLEHLNNVTATQNISRVNKPKCVTVCCGWEMYRVEAPITPRYCIADILKPANPEEIEPSGCVVKPTRAIIYHINVINAEDPGI